MLWYYILYFENKTTKIDVEALVQFFWFEYYPLYGIYTESLIIDTILNVLRIYSEM